jgi:hypothetical protein
MTYSDIFTKPTQRRGETSKLLGKIGEAVKADIHEARLLSLGAPKEALHELVKINVNFHEVYMKVRWADGFKELPEIRYELHDLQTLINSCRDDIRTIASIYMNENKSNG